MKPPFSYGVLAKGSSFTNRAKELRKLKDNFSYGINTIIISPRRWGKSSLVHRAASGLSRKKDSPAFVFIDLYDIRSEEEFYQKYAEAVLSTASKKIEDILDLARSFLGRLLPKISVSPDPFTKFSLSFELKDVSREHKKILELPEALCKKKGIEMVVCIDEFQNLETFNDPLAFQKKLRAAWQKQEQVSYCIYGSKRHMLEEFFSGPSMPFYNFGEILYLDKISEKHWIKFIVSSFEKTGKSIANNEAKLISSLVECHPYYVQQLAQQCWFRTANKCSAVLIIDAHDSLIKQMSLLFRHLADDLSTTQIQFLKAYLSGESQISSTAVRRSYGLGSSGNVNRIKEALVKKEIMEDRGFGLEFIDPLFKAWFKRRFLKEPNH